MKKLNIADFPLHGQRLIEASAGTGKTFTIAGLYNRLLLGHGRRSDAQQPARLACDQILVVTFTVAATAELRGRIRARLRHTFEDCLRLENKQSMQDQETYQYLLELAQQCGLTEAELNSSVQTELKPWLQANLALMDEASIYTIHGFCQRMLKQFAFDSGVMFSAEMVLDSERYLLQACEDIWRQHAYRLNEPQSRFLLSQYAGPQALMQTVRSRLARPDMTVLPALPTADFATLWEQTESAFLALQAQCRNTNVADLAQLIADSGLDKRSYNSKHTPNWLGQIVAYGLGEFYPQPPECSERFTRAFMSEKLKSGELPQHPMFSALEALLPLVRELNRLLDLAWQERIAARYFELLEQAGALTPDDLLRLLQAALAGPQGERLAAHIRRLYPVAMIDEFQDTDARQFDIFNRIYPPAASGESPDDQHHSLIMIGDPKQAIYAFRGADIFTYIKARRNLTAEQRFTLDTNWRSHSQLIKGVNQLFAGNASPFIFDNDIEFIEVQAGGRHDNKGFAANGRAQIPLQLWHDGKEYSRHGAQQATASQCAAQIAALLNGAGTLAGQPVQARDIAVLVRSRKQAGWIRDALAQQNIGSVFLTRDSVFDSQEALDVFRWLEAIAHPSDERIVRSALATETQGYSAEKLHQLLNNESEWERVLQTHQDYHKLWNTRGIMAALLKWLESEERAQRLRCLPQGERRLTNLLHLGELLQSASRRLRGHEALLRWLGEHVFSEESSSDEAQLRLESDANLVNIVTIHKSKGLQYPLVFLPYCWDDSYLPNGKADTCYFDDRLGMVLNLQPDDDAKDLAIRDSLAESLRLLYVALTRAEQGCFVWLMDAVDGRTKKSTIANSALGYLLNLEKTPDWAELHQRANADVYIGDLPDWQAAVVPQADTAAGKITARTIQPRRYDSWRVTSYSQLADGHAPTEAAALPLADAALRDDEFPSTRETEAPEEQAEPHPVFTFAKGANAGTCLHAMLELWDFHDIQALNTLVPQQLARYGLLVADEQEQAEQCRQVSGWLQAIVRSPQQDQQGNVFCLADIQPGQRLDEMEFYLPVAGLKPYQVDQLLQSHSPRFNFSDVSGYLKGFIDLIFAHNGRYYVADYKSNHLGNRPEDYHPEALQQAMQEHRYDLQAWIYTLALDQLLRQRLPDYDPQQHLGGVFYYFLRGMPFAADVADTASLDTAQPSAGIYYLPPDWPQLQRWHKVVCQGEPV